MNDPRAPLPLEERETPERPRGLRLVGSDDTGALPAPGQHAAATDEPDERTLHQATTDYLAAMSLPVGLVGLGAMAMWTGLGPGRDLTAHFATGLGALLAAALAAVFARRRVVVRLAAAGQRAGLDPHTARSKAQARLDAAIRVRRAGRSGPSSRSQRGT